MECPDIMDVEASGFGSGSYPIEIGYSLGDGNRDCFLIKPLSGWIHWESDAEQLHGISRADLDAAGQAPQTVCSELNWRLKGRTLYSDAWDLDSKWLQKLFLSVDMTPSFSLRAIEHIQSEKQHLLWDQVRADLMPERDDIGRHRASADAEFIQRVFLKTRSLC